MLVEDFVVVICYSCMFLVFHEFNEMKYRARRCINGTEMQYMLKYMLNYIVRAREVIAIWSVGFNLTFDVDKKAWYSYSPK